MKLRKDFLMTTNDGTKGDWVNRIIGEKKSRFFFPVNGVDNRDIDPTSPRYDHYRYLGKNFIIYPARIDSWKRQDKALEVVALLKNEYRVPVTLVFAGHISDAAYYKSLKQQTRDKAMDDNVVFLGPIPHDDLLYLEDQAIALLSFYDVSNFGNVAIEALKRGVIVVSLNDGSLDNYIEHEKTGFLVNSSKEAAAIVRRLIQKTETTCSMKQRIRIANRNVFKTWNERAFDEYMIIDRVIGKSRRR